MGTYFRICDYTLLPYSICSNSSVISDPALSSDLFGNSCARIFTRWKFTIKRIKRPQGNQLVDRSYVRNSWRFSESRRLIVRYRTIFIFWFWYFGILVEFIRVRRFPRIMFILCSVRNSFIWKNEFMIWWHFTEPYLEVNT